MVAKLELRGITKRYGERDAVRNVSLALEQGEFFSLLGPSGCGKSTTLAMIAGLLAPDAGEIAVDGRVINGLSPQRRRIGLVFQDYAVFTSLSVRNNLAFGLEANGVGRARRRTMVEAFARQLDLDDLLDRRGASLNMSEMQRVAMARVLITEPQLLLLDEPMSNLDAELRARLRGELRQIQKSLAQTVFYVTHDQAEALSMSDRIAVMRDGQLLQVGTPDEIYHRPVNRFVAEFIGDPPINVIPCEVRREGSRRSLLLPGMPPIPVGGIPIDPGSHWLAVRPHDIALAPGRQADSVEVVLRFVENFGAEHVLHVEYGGELIRVEAPPAPRSTGEVLSISFNLARMHLIERTSERALPLLPTEVAA
jgi:multiple sugar transport system ATP-binding protein